jgi:hypothetical protein
MIVYCVMFIGDEYETARLIDIFATEELANEWIIKNTTFQNDYDIWEREVIGSDI